MSLMIVIRHRTNKFPCAAFPINSPDSLLNHFLFVVTIHQFCLLQDFFKMESDSGYRVTELWQQSLRSNLLLKQEFHDAIKLFIQTSRCLTTTGIKWSFIFAFCSVLLSAQFSWMETSAPHSTTFRMGETGHPKPWAPFLLIPLSSFIDLLKVFASSLFSLVLYSLKWM